MTAALEDVLGRARALGLLGPGPISTQIEHAMAFALAWESGNASPPAALLDLGSGGGLPGLVLATRWEGVHVTLLDASERRGSFLRSACEELALTGSTTVVIGRAEVLARAEELDGSFELVTARSFGPPAPTAECGARLLGPRGVLLVADPPVTDGADPLARWPAEGLALLGLGGAEVASVNPTIVRVHRLAPCPARFPRRDGMPAKRPLF